MFIYKKTRTFAGILNVLLGIIARIEGGNIVFDTELSHNLKNNASVFELK